MISIETYRAIQKHKDYGASMLKTSQIIRDLARIRQLRINLQDGTGYLSQI